MVKVYVKTDGAEAATTFWPQDTAELLQLVEAEFGSGGRLKTSDGGVIGTAFPLEEGAILAWHPPVGGQAHATQHAIAEMADNIMSIKRLVTASSESTRHASTIKDPDLDAVEAALQICFVPVETDNLDSASRAALEDNQEFQREDNRHEARHRDDYLNVMASKVQLPPHLTWSKQTDRQT